MIMDSIFDTFKATGVLHHAHLVLGVPSENRRALEPLLLALLGGKTVGHPDLWELQIEQMGIDESRSLREEQSHQPFEATRRIFIVQTFGVTEPGQHALLKTLEDPNPTSHFFLLLPSLQDILPTLRSRFMITRGIGPGESEKEFAEAFLKKYPADRIKLLEKFGLAAIDPDKKKETRRALEACIQSMETILHKKLRGNQARDARKALEEVFLVKNYLADPAAALRMLMEHLALVLPVFEG